MRVALSAVAAGLVSGEEARRERRGVTGVLRMARKSG